MEKKRILFLAVCILLCGIAVNAQEDVTNMYIKNADLSSFEGWDYGDDGYNYTQYWANCDVPVIDFYYQWGSAGTSIGSTRNFHFSQTVTLPAGSYRLAVSSFYREGNGNGTNNKAYIFAGEKTQYLVGLTSGGLDRYAGRDDTYKAANAFSLGDFSNEIDFDLETEQEITIGLRGYIDTYCSWCLLGPFKLYKLSNDDDAKYAYMRALEEARELMATNETISQKVMDFLQQTVISYGEDKVDQTSTNALHEAISALNEANSLAKTSIASYRIIASGVIPTDNLEGWSSEKEQGFDVNTWSKEGDDDGSGMTTPFIQEWVGRDTPLQDDMIYYTLAGLEPGEKYEVEALVRVYSEAGNNPNSPIYFVNDKETDISAEGTLFVYSGVYDNMKGYYGTFSNVAEVGEDGKLTVGLKIENANYNWVSIKDVSIRNPNDALQAAIDKVISYRDDVPAAMQSEIDNLQSNISGEFDLTTLESIEEAIQNLEEMAADYARAADIYNKYKILRPYGAALASVDNDNECANSTLTNTMKGTDREVNEALNSETINSACESLYEAMVTYATEANPTKDNKFDLTFMLLNPNLEGLATWTEAEGWYTDQTDGSSQVMTNEQVNSADGTKTAFYEYWSVAAKANNLFTLYQKVTLAPGIYNMSCYAFAQQDMGGNVRGVKFYANDTEGSTIQTDILSPASIEFVQTETGEVKVGLKAVTGNTYRWMGIGYLELYKLSPIKEAYAILTDDPLGNGKNLLFYYDSEKSTHTETLYSLNEGENFPAWNDEQTAAEITGVAFHCDFSEALPTSGYCWFYEMSNLEHIDDMQFFDTSNMTTMAGMFFYCSKLNYIGAQGFDTSRTTNMWAMFYGCSALEELDVSGFNTSLVTDMTGMFCYCGSLATLDVSHFDTGNVTSFNGMFYGCKSLTSLDLGNFDLSSATDTQNMLAYCTGLTELTVSLSMQNLADGACAGIGTASSPCTIYAPAGFNFGVSTSGSCFQWKGGYFRLGAQTALLGDVNASGSVTLADAICEISWLLEQNPPVFVEAVADYNQDNVVSVSDAIAIIQYVVTVEPDPIRPDVPDEDVAKLIEEMSHLRSATNGFDLTLGDLRDYTAFTADITLGDDATLLSASLGTHSVATHSLGGGRYRIVAWSMDMAPIGAGAVLHCKTTGGNASAVTLDHIRIVDMNTREHAALAVECTPTGIREVETGAAPTVRYRIDGTRVSSPQRGIYIEDGRKVMR